MFPSHDRGASPEEIGNALLTAGLVDEANIFLDNARSDRQVGLQEAAEDRDAARLGMEQQEWSLEKKSNNWKQLGKWLKNTKSNYAGMKSLEQQEAAIDADIKNFLGEVKARKIELPPEAFPVLLSAEQEWMKGDLETKKGIIDKIINYADMHSTAYDDMTADIQNYEYREGLPKDKQEEWDRQFTLGKTQIYAQQIADEQEQITGEDPGLIGATATKAKAEDG